MTMAALVIHQGKNFRNLISGRPLTTPSLGSMTLDEDDVLLARRFIRDHSQWNQFDITSTFEKEFARWNGSQHAFAFMGGRVALSACIHALDLMPGDEVILPGYTCVVVPNAFHFARIKTVFADIELDTYGLDAAQVEKKNYLQNPRGSPAPPLRPGLQGLRGHPRSGKSSRPSSH